MNNINVIYLGIGSNLNKQENIKSCLNHLKSSFKNIQISPIYQSSSYGFDGNDFHNLVVKIESVFNLSDLKQWLIKIEDFHDRDRSKPRYSNRTLDIDILLFNDDIVNQNNFIIPRAEILTQAYVLKPLADLSPDFIHPITQKLLIQHWQELKYELGKIYQII